jgi:hypothetical protein
MVISTLPNSLIAFFYRTYNYPNISGLIKLIYYSLIFCKFPLPDVDPQRDQNGTQKYSLHSTLNTLDTKIIF